jgi:hypothetical protein
LEPVVQLKEALILQVTLEAIQYSHQLHPRVVVLVVVLE